jgi:hypothetical protein
VIVALMSPAAAVAAGRDTSLCQWRLIPPATWIGDPAATYLMVGGLYNDPGNTGVAYKMTGQLGHATTQSLTAYNDLEDLLGPAYQLLDLNWTPSPGSVNPYLPGTLVEAPNRSYTAWLWPDSVPVPKDLGPNVVLYPTTPVDPNDSRVRWEAVLRQYHVQPGFTTNEGRPTIQAVSTTNPNVPVPCPLSRVGLIARQVQTFLAHNKFYDIGPATGTATLGPPPEPTSGNKIYFTRVPAQYGVGLEGLSQQGSITYLGATVPLDKITVVTQRLPTFFNNNLVTPTTVMRDFNTYWNSQTVIGWPALPSNSINQDDAIFTSDSNMVTVWLPSDPRLRPAQIRQVRALAAKLGYNVVALPGKAVTANPIGRQIPRGIIGLRQQRASATFCCNILNVPGWTDPNNPATANNNYLDYPKQTSPQYFATYASNPGNMGAYWIGGVTYAFEEFMQHFG